MVIDSDGDGGKRNEGDRTVDGYSDGNATEEESIEPVAVEVALSRELLDDIDQFAVHRGYSGPSAVVRHAIAEQSDS